MINYEEINKICNGNSDAYKRLYLQETENPKQRRLSRANKIVHNK